MIIAPVRLRDRWIDDGSSIELWNADRSIGLRLAVARTSKTKPSLAAMEIRRITMDEPGGSTSLILDLSSGEVRFQGDPGDAGDALAPPLDLAWLRGRLDGELRAALQHRLDRQSRDFDPHDWKDGDRPRVVLGERAAFAQLFPAAWDLVVTHRGRRYALIDSHRVAPEAKVGPIALEIVDLERREPVGTAAIDLALARNPPTGRRRTRPWRSSGSIVDPVLGELWDDADRWFELIGRAEVVARTAIVMQTWDSDVRDPGAVVAALLAEPGEEDEMLQYRVKALGSRCVPALRRALAATNAETSRYAARLLAELGDASGLDLLVATLGDPAFDDPGGESFVMADAIAVLGDRAVEPLLAALARTADRDAQDRLLDAVTAIGAHDDRVRDLLVAIVRAEPGRASLLADYGDRSPAVVGVLVELLEVQLGLLRGGPDDVDEFDDASELAEALRELDVHDGPVQQFMEIAKMRREARLAQLRASRPARDPALSEPMPSYAPPVPVHVTPRPGRNEPCWCGSTKKYKKCHLEADDEARIG
jgi:hypothetical protein